MKRLVLSRLPQRAVGVLFAEACLRALRGVSSLNFRAPVTIKREDFWEGQRVIVVSGKGNTKDGREYNKKLDAVIREANEQLKSLPEWKDYIVNHYGIARTCIGEQSGRGFGFAMLSTYGGKHPQRMIA